MRPFEYHAPASLDDAVALVARLDDFAVMSGGTSLVLLMREELVRPAHVVSLRGVPELRGIAREGDGSLRLGATTTLREAELSPTVSAHCPALAEAFAAVATVRIRNQATVGGALAHADPAQDPPVMLVALDAEVAVRGAATARKPLDGFFVDVFATALGERDVITAVRVPPLPPGARAAYLKFLPRTRDDYATVSVGVVAARDRSGQIVHLRVTLGAVGPTVIRARAVEDALRGRAGDDRELRDAAALVRDAVDPFDDARGSAAYKREMARVWTERALRAVLR